MAELKVYHCNEWHNEYTEFYMKSEVDAVIAEKDTEIRRLKFQLWSAKFEAAKSRVRRPKKRSLPPNKFKEAK